MTSGQMTNRGRATGRLLSMHLLALLAAFLPCHSREEARKPNVVLIVADDLGYQDLGCFGHPSIRTPALDQLAKDGVRLTDFHSGATVCTPSRMAILTGAYPVRLGWIRGVLGFKMGLDEGMSPDALTIAEIFKSAGYATGISGKWHIGSLPDCLPHRQGFDSSYYITLSNNQTKKLWREDELVEDSFDNRMLTGQFTVEAIRFIEDNRDRPFFLYLPYTAPHFPVQPHPQWKGRSRFGNYGDVVEELDGRVGQLVETLDRCGILRQTIIVFTSDNGPQPCEPASPLPFRGEKWSALEGGTRVPCIVSWQGVIPPGRTIDALTSAMDLLPTLCRASGIDWKSVSHGSPKIDGLDVWDTLLGKGGAHPRTELLYWHGMNPKPQAIRVGSWKLFFDRSHALEGMGTDRATPEQAEKLSAYREAPRPPGKSPPFLFNLSDDPAEIVDLSAEHPEMVSALQKRAESLIAEFEADEPLPLTRP